MLASSSLKMGFRENMTCAPVWDIPDVIYHQFVQFSPELLLSRSLLLEIWPTSFLLCRHETGKTKRVQQAAMRVLYAPYL